MKAELRLRNRVRRSARSRRRQNVYKHVTASLEHRRDFLERRLAVKKRKKGKKRSSGKRPRDGR